VTTTGAVTDTGADMDTLILVDEADRSVGHLSKVRCHEGRGILHRAFSLLIFNGSGELLLQQRAATKRLWPLFWSNSCCSHPRSTETMEAAIQRRLYEELGLRVRRHWTRKWRAAVRGTLPLGSCSNGPGFGGITAPKCWICNLKLGSAGLPR
jgi:8-oxo-dGTP pyrophosphatase MutT (NUDIX family)